MFLTVTLNPALDKTLEVDHNTPLATIRARRVINLAGGKGVNVARALRGLGAPVRCLLPLGGHTGEETAVLAQGEGIETAPVPVSGATRLAVTVRCRGDVRTWHYLEPGPDLDEQDLARIREGFLWAADGCHTAAICGSIPCPAAGPLVAWMCRAARERGMRVALDSFGPEQRGALSERPWLVKPTLEEWTRTLGPLPADTSARLEALQELARSGIGLAVLTLGDDGALAASAKRRFIVRPPRVQAVNELGSGDAMVAGILWAAREGMDLRECLAWGAACGAANAAVWDPGAITREAASRLLSRVEVVEIRET